MHPHLQRHVRVVRGPDWPKNNDDDGGDGGLGTVKDVDHEARRITVAWDNGIVGEYNAGRDDQYQLLLYDNSRVFSIRHFYVTCDSCKEEPIRGVRWKCLDCYDFDLCNTCYMNGDHELNHGFMRVTSYGNIGIRVPVRKDAMRMRARGFFPGAAVTLHRKGKEGYTKGTITKLSRDATASICLEDETSEEVGLFRSDSEIEVKADTCTEGDHFYKGHLAKLGEDLGIQKGDTVCVMIDEESFQAIQSSHVTAWREGMETLIGGIGIVFDVHGTYCAVGYLNGNRLYVDPTVLFKIQRFKKNDKVRINDDYELATRLHNYDRSWDDSIKKALGNDGRVVSYSEGGKANVRVEGFDDKVAIHPGLLEFKEHGTDKDADPDEDDEEEEDQISSSDDSDDDDELSTELAVLIASANDGSASAVKEILTEKPHLTNKKYNGTGVIHIASSSNPEVLKVVIEAGGKVQLRDKKRSTPIQYAAEGDQPECIRILVENGAGVNSANRDGYTALHAAAKEGNLESARVLLQSGAKVNLKEKRGMTAFHLTSIKGFVKCAELLIEFDCDINTQDRHGDSPAHDAIVQDADTIELIINHPKFKPGVTNQKGFNIIQYAALREKERMLALLVKKFPEMVNKAKEDRFTALHVAVLNGHLGCVKILHEQGKCELNEKNNIGHTPLHVAVETDQMPEMEYLLDNGAKPNIADIFGKMPLHLAASKYKEGTTLTETPTLKEINSKYKKFGVTNTTAAVMCLLVQKGADITPKEKNGRTPLSYLDNKKLKSLLETLSKGETPDLEELSETSKEDSSTSQQAQGTVIEGLHRISISQITTEKMLGRGSFGLVTKATWRGTPVAVKAIPIDVAVRERVEQQLSIHRQTTHPNIVELMALSFDPDKSEILIVMEFIDGKSLYDIIFPLQGEVRLDQSDKINISKQILQAVSFIHRSRILHLNIKPANILLDAKTKKAYLSDLGLAHMKFSSKDTEEENDIFQGTVNYIPPEGVNQSNGAGSDRFTPAYDVWSLGCTLLETFAEKELWGDDVEVYFVIAQLMQGKARPPILDDVVPSIRTILEPCFAQNPADRPTAAKLLSEFQHVSDKK